MKKVLIPILFLLLQTAKIMALPQHPFVLILGTAQDAGYPQAGCTKVCCKQAWQTDSLRQYPTCFAVADPASKTWLLFEAGPNLKEQLQLFNTLTNNAYTYLPQAIFITHAHIGHYLGLAQLGREVMNTKDMPVYVLPRLQLFLQNNGPWSQLVSLHNIALKPLDTATVNTFFTGNNTVNITCFTVPHRDEFSETAGFDIAINAKHLLFIPDIDKWEKWPTSIVAKVQNPTCFAALLDATFYNENDLPGKRISQVPHPFVTETMALFNNSNTLTKSKIYFIHFNHTNPLLYNPSAAAAVIQQAYHIAKQGQLLTLQP